MSRTSRSVSSAFRARSRLGSSACSAGGRSASNSDWIIAAPCSASGRARTSRIHAGCSAGAISQATKMYARHTSTAPRSSPNRKPNERSTALSALPCTCRDTARVSSERISSVTVKMTPPAATSASSGSEMNRWAIGRAYGRPKTTARAAPTQAVIDNTSWTKPRAKARTAETSRTPTIARSATVNGNSGTTGPPLAGRGGRRLTQQRQEIADMADLDQPRVRWGTRASPRRHDRGAEPQLRRLLEPRVGARHGAHLAGEADLAEYHRLGRQRPGERGGGQRRGDRQAGRRLADPPPAGDVEKHVGGAERHAAARFEDRQDHRQPGAVPADHGAPRRGERGGSDQRLDLDQHRPGSLDAGEHRRAGDLALALGEEQRRRVRHLVEPAIGHREDADLVGRTEAVLHRPQDAELVAAFAFEIEHRIDHVFEHLGPRDDAVLGDVPDEQQNEPVPLGQPDQRLRRRAHLSDRPRRRVQLAYEQRLDGIDDDDVRSAR